VATFHLCEVDKDNREDAISFFFNSRNILCKSVELKLVMQVRLLVLPFYDLSNSNLYMLQECIYINNMFCANRKLTYFSYHPPRLGSHIIEERREMFFESLREQEQSWMEDHDKDNATCVLCIMK
jgi:hypothetical protein